MRLRVYTPAERDAARLRPETVADGTVFGHSISLMFTFTEGYYLTGPALAVLYPGLTDAWCHHHAIHGADDDDAVKLMRREVLVMAKRALDQLGYDFGEYVPAVEATECGYGYSEELPPCGKCARCVFEDYLQRPLLNGEAT